MSVPVSVPVFPDLVDDVDDVLAADQNNPNDEITAMAGMVGMLGAVQSRSLDFLDALINKKPPVLQKIDAASFYVLAGAVGCANSGQSIRVLRRNSADVTVTASNIDTGSMATGLYYVYAVADAAATTFTVKFSLSASAPTGATYYELIGWFYNESNGSLDITNGYISNVKNRGRAVPNAVTISGATDISTASTSFVDMTTMTIQFYSSGGMCSIFFDAVFDNAAVGVTGLQITIDGNSVKKTLFSLSTNTGQFSLPMMYAGILAAGLHTIKIQWKNSGGNGLQYGSTQGQRNLLVMEN